MFNFKFKKYRLLAVFLLCTLITAYMPVNSYAFCLFQSDYDSDKWTEERITYDIPEGIDSNWLPLRAASEYLPIDISWDNNKREVVVYSHPMYRIYPNLAERRYSADIKYSDLKIVNGVTYCTPKFINRILGGYGFIYENELYFFDGEFKNSKLISDGNSEVFTSNVITAMYELKLKMPEEYVFVRKHITGGIKYIPIDKVDDDASGAVAYMITRERKPKCYIVGDSYENYTLASYIAHEAYHIWQYQNYGHDGVIENDANKYERNVYNTLRGPM